MKSWSSLGMVCAAMVALGGCSTETKQDSTEREITAFEQKLAGGMSVVDACNELAAMCKATGFGCSAHALFCQVPDKTVICQKLAETCTTYPAACDVYNDYCRAPDIGVAVCGNGLCQAGESCKSCPKDCGVCPDIKPFTPDIGVPTCGNGLCQAGESCKSCPKDCGPCRDTQPPGLEAWPPKKEAGPYVEAGPKPCTPDDPSTPLVNEDSCLPGQCVNGKCVAPCTPDNPQTPLVNEDSCPSPSTMICVNGKCVPKCTSDDPSTPLVNEDSCGPGLTCFSGKCAPCTPDDPSTPLVNEDNCGGYRKCYSGKCG